MAQGDEAYSQSLEEFLDKIRTWYDKDYEGFRGAYDKAVRKVVPYPKDTPEEVRFDWKGQGVDTLCQFFTDWYNWESGVHDGLDYIEKFSWLNYENPDGVRFVTSGPGREMTADFTHLQGMQMDGKLDGDKWKKLIKRWVKELGPKRMDDYKVEDWQTFNDFFVREIKEGRRPIDAKDDASVVVAPADCVINMIVDDLTEKTQIPVKTKTMSLEHLLANSDYAKHFVGGTAVSCILMPDSYHWYHAPVAGEVVEACDDIGGAYYGIRDFPDLLDKGDVGYGYDYSDFENFRRGYVIIKTTYLNAHGGPDGEGYVGVVPVGLNSIASVNFEDKFQPPLHRPVRVEKGERIGNFKYGGSLNILLFEKDRFPAIQLLQGQRIGVLEPKQKKRKLFRGSYHTRSQRRRPLAP
ncbi:phosphatidylserine decarboxylase [Streptomyces sp. AV19]|uniref:phosphatidylserine decarboxylase n=1 Tax=Streptomyces sp. AV19 TaxID=2793068 RepID=UPI0018FE3574|nr:phosphatidylserine decarboxylase [Streptomyces sp. AV19]MBH1938739.1 phosphatidylserine decarboxylase [Streptomyces sp. AV19]MDG4533999.1 phosphatidylserine decarboxylase [Streptomyces sp. AV19]